jgi:4-amino-4-deoxy-L-arabinose transferase-like glycosyltransferase
VSVEILGKKGEAGAGGMMGGFRVRSGRIRHGVSFFSYSLPSYGWRLLVFFLLLVYVPFLGNRVVRPAGDDKVYVSQTVEMAKAGHWFLQTLGGEPNYYKGPLHYILLRIGMLLFHTSMWATVYMNLLFVLVAAVALGALVYRNMREFEGWAFWVAMAFGVNAGIYSHMFASQMEVEAACLMVLGLFYLDRAGPGRGDFRFWIVAGLLGWLKSPLHSVLLGTSALLFWTWNGELLPRLRSPLAWAAVFTGVLVSAAGYAPAYFFDRENFWNAYVLRETLWKPANGSAWHYPVIPFFTYFLLPWMLPAFVAYLDSFSRLWRRQRPIKATPGSRRLVALGVCLILPSVCFFAWHPYRGQNYNLPVIGGLLLIVAATWATRAASWNALYQLSLTLTSLAMLALPVGLTYLSRRFDPLPYWWPSWLLPVIWLGAFLSARGFFREGITFNMARPDSLARRSLWIFLAIGCLNTTLGEREMIDIRDRLYQAKKEGKTLTFSYYNLQKNIWCEWGYLNFMIPYPVSGLYSQAALEQAVRAGDTILVPGDEWLDDMHQHLDKVFPGAQWRVEPWRRWKTKGKNAQGIPAWQDAWDHKDIRLLERNFYMVQVKPVGSS